MLYYVKINDFEGLDHSEGEGCTRDRKSESGQYPGGPLSNQSSIKRTTFEKKNFHIIKESLQLDVNNLCYVKINDFEGLDHSERQGCKKGHKIRIRTAGLPCFLFLS